MLTQKARPKTYEQVAGQKIPRSLLLSISKNPQNSPKCIILSGSFGTGKTTTARILARSLNCQHKKANGDACGKCDICNMQLDQSPFYTEYDSSQLRLETIRSLVDTWYVSMSSGYRVIVLDEAHLLSKQVQSALLKVFEEPPQNTFFCLATTDVDKILPTIRSRSLEIVFNEVSSEDMRNNILSVSQDNSIEIDDEVIDRIIKVSNGHMRNAHMELDKFLLIGREQYLELFKSSYDSIDKYFQSITVRSKDKCFESIDEILQYPLVIIRDDFESYILDLTRSLVTEPNNIVQALGANTLKLVKFTMSDWFKSCFGSDVELQTGLLCLYQLMTDVPVTQTVQRTNSNARR